MIKLSATEELKTENFYWIKWYMPVESRIILKYDLGNKYTIKGQSILIRTYMAIINPVELNGQLIFYQMSLEYLGI